MTLAELIEERGNGAESDPVSVWAKSALVALRTAHAVLRPRGDAYRAVDKVLRATEEEV